MTNKKHPPILFLDTETLGFNGPVWEIGMLLAHQASSEVQGFMDTHQSRRSFFVRHDFVQSEFDTMPESFRNDYRARYDPDEACTVDEAIKSIGNMVDRVGEPRSELKVAGSNPGYDLRHLEKMTGGHDFSWHYAPLDVPTLATGWLFGRGIPLTPPYRSEFISRVCGVDPKDFARHTALGDCQWMHALWQAVAL